MEVRYVGEDWDRLRQLVEASTLPGRAEVLAVIDNTDIFKGREKKLMDLQGGVPYNLMMAELFPLLRRSKSGWNTTCTASLRNVTGGN